jgi:hypothetical protein
MALHNPFAIRLGATYAARHASKSFLIHRDRHSWRPRSFLEDSSSSGSVCISTAWGMVLLRCGIFLLSVGYTGIDA